MDGVTLYHKRTGNRAVSRVIYLNPDLCFLGGQGVCSQGV